MTNKDFRAWVKNIVKESLGDVSDEVIAKAVDLVESKGLGSEFKNAITKLLEEELNSNEDLQKVDEIFKKVVRAGKVIKKKIRRIKKRLSAAQKAALRKARKKAFTGAAMRKRAKSMKIHRRKLGEAFLNVGVSSIVKEAFDLVVNNNEIIEVQEGYFMAFTDVDENTISVDVYDAEGEAVKEGIMVDAEFVQQCCEESLIESLQDYGILLDEEFCNALEKGLSVDEVFNDLIEFDEIEEEVVDEKKKNTDEEDAEEEDTEEDSEEEENPEDEEETEDEEEAEESAMKLGFSDTGYYIIKEGKRYELGSRLRARAYLVKEGITPYSEMFEKARTMEVIVK